VQAAALIFGQGGNDDDSSGDEDGPPRSRSSMAGVAAGKSGRAPRRSDSR
jgi:hypothetical protein